MTSLITSRGRAMALITVLVALVALGLHPAGVRAQSADAAHNASPKPAETVWTRQKLLGDIGGLRSGLGKHGIGLDLRLSQFYQNVVDGGVDTGGAYGAVMDYIVNVDGEKLGLWKGLFGSLKAQTQFGNYDSFVGKPGSLALTNTALLYPLPGQSRTEITGWTVGQFVSKDVMVYGGKLNSVDLQTGFFPHIGGGLVGFSNTNLIAPAIPWFRFVEFSMLGGGIQKNGPRGLEYGVIAYDPVNRSTTADFDNLFEDIAGLIYYRAYFDLGDKPGNLTFGFGGSTKAYGQLEPSSWLIGSTPEFDLVVPGFRAETNTGAWALTGYYNQILWQAGAKGARNIRFFGGMTLGSDEPGLATWSGFGTVEFTGYFPSRPKDRFGVGGFYNNLASSLVQTTTLLGSPMGDTSGFEIYYNAELTPWLHLGANLQLVNSATAGTSTSVVPGVRTVINF